MDLDLQDEVSSIFKTAEIGWRPIKINQLI
jgi:hypothetical protein